jgi:hypothetical protein
VHRTYLFVPPEEKSEVQSLGAHWDNDTKRWYIDLDQPSAKFARWLPGANEVDAQEDATFTIVSNQAYVAATTVSCQQCNSNIEVICIHCESGTASGEPLTRFTVSHIWAIDEALEQQLRPWPNFRKVRKSNGGFFANHCPHCGVLQDDLYLHTEPGDPFFDIPSAPSGSIRLSPLAGTVRLSGDEHFQVG